MLLQLVDDVQWSVVPFGSGHVVPITQVAPLVRWPMQQTSRLVQVLAPQAIPAPPSPTTAPSPVDASLAPPPLELVEPDAPLLEPDAPLLDVLPDVPLLDVLPDAPLDVLPDVPLLDVLPDAPLDVDPLDAPLLDAPPLDAPEEPLEASSPDPLPLPLELVPSVPPSSPTSGTLVRAVPLHAAKKPNTPPTSPRVRARTMCRLPRGRRPHAKATNAPPEAARHTTGHEPLVARVCPDVGPSGGISRRTVVTDVGARARLSLDVIWCGLTPWGPARPPAPALEARRRRSRAPAAP
jgi:hypothetical protein